MRPSCFAPHRLKFADFSFSLIQAYTESPDFFECEGPDAYIQGALQSVDQYRDPSMKDQAKDAAKEKIKNAMLEQREPAHGRVRPLPRVVRKALPVFSAPILPQPENGSDGGCLL